MNDEKWVVVFADKPDNTTWQYLGPNGLTQDINEALPLDNHAHCMRTVWDTPSEQWSSYIKQAGTSRICATPIFLVKLALQ